MALKRSQLVAAAKDLNETLGLEPAIDTKPGKKNAHLEDKIKEASKLVNPDEDELEEGTWEVLKGLDIDVSTSNGEQEEEEQEEEEQEEQEEEEQEEEEQEEEEQEEEEQEEEEPEPEPAKDKKKDKGKAKPTKEGKKKKSGELSNKAKVYQAWQKNETDVTKLSKLVSGAVKETTIKSWMNQWKNGKNLPAIAKT